MRHATKVTLSGLGVSVEGILGQWPSSMLYGMACLFDKWGPPSEYGDTLKMLNGSQKFCSLLLNKGQDCPQETAEVAWLSETGFDIPG